MNKITYGEFLARLSKSVAQSDVKPLETIKEEQDEDVEQPKQVKRRQTPARPHQFCHIDKVGSSPAKGHQAHPKKSVKIKEPPFVVPEQQDNVEIAEVLGIKGRGSKKSKKKLRKPINFGKISVSEEEYKHSKENRLNSGEDVPNEVATNKLFEEIF